MSNGFASGFGPQLEEIDRLFGESPGGLWTDGLFQPYNISITSLTGGFSFALLLFIGRAGWQNEDKR